MYHIITTYSSPLSLYFYFTSVTIYNKPQLHFIYIWVSSARWNDSNVYSIYIWVSGTRWQDSDVHFSFLSSWNILWIELPWPENPANTSHDMRKDWTDISTLLGLISRVYHDLYYWRSNQRPQIAELKLYNWATSPYRTEVKPNQLVMVIVQPINLNVSCKLHPYTYRGHGYLQAHVFPRGLEIRIHVIIMTSKVRILMYIFLFLIE